MPGRKFTSTTNYKYGFNGKEEDDEVKGDGNQQDYGMRIYDTRLGRFLSVDPISADYPWYTPYQFAGNKPIWATDLDGLEENTTSTYIYKQPILTNQQFLRPFQGSISISENSAKRVHKIFEGSIVSLSRYDKYFTGIVHSLIGSTVGTSTSKLDIKTTGLRREVSKSWKGTDVKYFTQFSYSFTNNNTTEIGTFEIQAGVIQSARVWDPAVFLLVNKVVSSIVVAGAARTAAGKTLANEEMVTVFRSISKAEAESIQATGRLSFAEGQMEVKQFWQTTDGLNNFNKSGFAGEFNLEMTIPRSLIGKGKPLNTATQPDEFFGPNVTIDGASHLQIVNQNVQSFKITPIIK